MNDKATSYQGFLTATAVAAGLTFASFGTAPAAAQNFAEGLEDLGEMVLVVERLTAESETCGLERPQLAEMMRDEIKDTGLILTETGPTLYLNINSAVVGEVCFSSAELSVHYFTQVPHPTRVDGAIAQVVLWDDAFIASSELSTHGTYLTDLVREMSRDFVDDWRSANPRLLLTNERPAGSENAPILNAAPGDDEPQ